MTNETRTAKLLPTATAKPELGSYDHVLVMFSGGKDSLACLLHLVDQGADMSKVELWHHDVDGREGSDLMDWAPTRAYCRAVAKAFGLPIYFSWLVGGFEREMIKDGERKAPTAWENPDGSIGQAGGERGKLSTRRRFPQVSADLSVRWCSAYLKIDVAAAAIRNQARFAGKRVLVVTGERAQESAGRAKYATFEPNKADNRNAKRDASRRHVDHWRPVHGWTEAEVWAAVERHGINPHPAYRAGFGRVSCQFCIFGSPDQWAAAASISPERFERVAAYEQAFGVTIQRKENVRDRMARGTAYAMSEADRAACRSAEFSEPVRLAPGEWKLPLGAFAESCGPV